MKAEETRQATTQAEEPARNAGEAGLGAETDVTTRWRTKAEWAQASGLMEAVCERGNLMLAYQRVVKNKGAAGVDGIGTAEFKDTPQGGPLSPLLSNILLTELDRELERRGHAFCRYADDCNIYVNSKTAGERVMASITRVLAETLKLTVNAAKSAVAHPWQRKFLGYSLTWHKAPRLRIAPTSQKRLEDKIREILNGARGRSLSRTVQELNPVLRGWTAYFKLTETKKALEELDGWLRHKLRCILRRQWKRPYTRAKNLMKAGLTEERAFRSAFNQRGPWWNSGASHMNQAFPKSYFDRLGLVSLLDTTRRLQCVQ